MCLLLSSSRCPRFLFLSFDLSDDGNNKASKDHLLRPRSNSLYLHDCVDCCSGKVISFLNPIFSCEEAALEVQM